MSSALHCLKPSGTNHPVIRHQYSRQIETSTALLQKFQHRQILASTEFTLVHKLTTHSVWILREEIFHNTTRYLVTAKSTTFSSPFSWKCHTTSKKCEQHKILMSVGENYFLIQDMVIKIKSPAILLLVFTFITVQVLWWYQILFPSELFEINGYCYWSQQ